MLVFTISGILHVVHDSPGAKTTYGGTMLFFQAYAVAIMVEDGVQELWRRISGTEASTKERGNVPLWKKIVGFVWVIFCHSLFSPWFIYPMTRIDMNDRWIFPFEITEKIGASAAGAGIVLYGLILKLYYKAEL
jgi:hypothetical protein